jgi:hypothetical protein
MHAQAHTKQYNDTHKGFSINVYMYSFNALQHKWHTPIDVAMVFVYSVITLSISKTVSQSCQVAHDRLAGITRQCLNVH